jgi:GMP synthase-like glutamine amidotransferase
VRLQEIAWTFGGEECVQAHNKREYGVADINVVQTGSASADALFKGIAEDASVRPGSPRR